MLNELEGKVFLVSGDDKHIYYMFKGILREKSVLIDSLWSTSRKSNFIRDEVIILDKTVVEELPIINNGLHYKHKISGNILYPICYLEPDRKIQCATSGYNYEYLDVVDILSNYKLERQI